MEKSRHVAWVRHFDVIGDELLRLTTVCGVDLREPGVIERILKNDDTVCGKKNPIGFRKLRELLMATFNSLDKAMDRLGTAEAQKITDEIRQRLDARRALAHGGAANDRR
ncbi:MAG TPA: hypothetical protein VFO94_15605 [Gammaproteobacteria bacterium]|nr:hypothetical protein [Gammaproteobacteria bacterium]